ncbi:MAG TPA: hypothetical protein VFQ25_13615 [Ktedonobacterales bacterium]|nr:hypothetical protein [Ktedonobacterales bacterium]
MSRSAQGRARRTGLWLGLCLTLALASLLSGCAGLFGDQPTPTWTPIRAIGPGGLPTNTPPTGKASPLPTFTDWRLAYAGPDGRLHAVSLDGRTDSAGAALAFAGFSGLGVWAAGSSSDGRSLAYLSGGRLSILDAATGAQRSTLPHTGDSRLWWSPDQRYLALSGTAAVVRVAVADGASVSLPPGTAAPPRSGVGGPYGWIDATHVAVVSLSANTPTVTSLQSLDMTTGKLSLITGIRSDGGAAFAVEPGGASTLFWTSQFRANPFNPRVAVINNANGDLIPLPHLTDALSPYGYITLLWRPNSTQALVGALYPQRAGMTYSLIDVAKDTATPINPPGSPEAWTPDGAALIVATTGQQPITEASAGFNDIGAVGSGPYTLGAALVDAKGHVGAPVTLTTHAMTIPMLGFVHTA